jgi:hypothetical protein
MREFSARFNIFAMLAVSGDFEFLRENFLLWKSFAPCFLLRESAFPAFISRAG